MISHADSFPTPLQLARLLSPWDFPGKNTGVGCPALLKGIFLTQEWNPCLLHCQADFLPLSQGSPYLTEVFLHLYLVAQLCLTLCDPMDCSPPDSSVHGDSPGKNIGVGCHALLQEIFPTKGMLQSMRLKSQTRLSN